MFTLICVCQQYNCGVECQFKHSQIAITLKKYCILGTTNHPAAYVVVCEIASRGLELCHLAVFHIVVFIFTK